MVIQLDIPICDASLYKLGFCASEAVLAGRKYLFMVERLSLPVSNGDGVIR
jgi:hypothetical protein